MVFRKPKLVRANYFIGDIKDASVTYTMRPPRDDAQVQPPHAQTTVVAAPGPPPEPLLKVGDQISIVSIEDSPIQPGTVGIVTKIVPLGGEIVQIDFSINDEGRYSMIVPPDEYNKVA